MPSVEPNTPALTDELMREVRRLRLRARRRVNDLLAGEYHSAFKGRGIEFADVREYQPGDDVRTIDWKVTARSGKAFVKSFVEERRLTVMLAVDASASGVFGSVGRSKSRLAAEAAAVIAMVASRHNDRIGVLRFADRVEAFVPPRSGQRHQLWVLREVLAEPPHNAGDGLGEAATFLAGALKRRGIVFVISDFQKLGTGDPAASDALRRLAKRHEVIGLRVTDPLERALPRAGWWSGLLELTDPETGRSRAVDLASGRTRRGFAARAAEERRRVDRVFAEAGADLVDLRNEAKLGDTLAAYFMRRERRR